MAPSLLAAGQRWTYLEPRHIGDIGTLSGEELVGDVHIKLHTQAAQSIMTFELYLAFNL